MPEGYTIGFYDSDPEGYSEKTFECDMSASRNRFSSLLRKGARILDLGCGSGRDSLAFAQEGFDVTPVDGSEGMCLMAERNTGMKVRRMLFSELDYENMFDGVWACSSLLHVPSGDLPGILSRIRRALVNQGLLYVTFKKGGFEGRRDGRYYTDMDGGSLDTLAQTSGFEVLDMWDSLEPGRDVLWVNALLRAHPLP